MWKLTWRTGAGGSRAESVFYMIRARCCLQFCYLLVLRWDSGLRLTGPDRLSEFVQSTPPSHIQLLTPHHHHHHRPSVLLVPVDQCNSPTCWNWWLCKAMTEGNEVVKVGRRCWMQRLYLSSTSCCCSGYGRTVVYRVGGERSDISFGFSFDYCVGFKNDHTANKLSLWRIVSQGNLKSGILCLLLLWHSSSCRVVTPPDLEENLLFSRPAFRTHTTRGRYWILHRPDFQSIKLYL